MEKIFDVKNSNKLIKYYKMFFKSIKDTHKLKEQTFAKLIKEINNLYIANTFNKVIETSIKNKSIDLENNEIKEYIRLIYINEKIEKYYKKIEEYYNQNIDYINNLIKLVSLKANPIGWIFKSKQTKEQSENAFNELYEYKSAASFQSTLIYIDEAQKIIDQKLDFILEKFIETTFVYKDYFERNVKKEIENQLLAPIFNIHSQTLLQLNVKIDKINQKISEQKSSVTKAINYMLSNELLVQLKAMSVEELQREKAGIKVKTLMEAGYNNLADIYTSDVMEIASIYGISENAAYNIKAIVNNYSKNIKKELKLKFSTDEKNKYSTNAIEEIYKYLVYKNYIKLIEEQKIKTGDTISNYINDFKLIGSGASIVFFDSVELEDLINKYSYVEKELYKTYKPNVENIYRQSLNSIDKSHAWADFSNDPVKYYNAIEEIFPGVLGNDDSIYGLPKDLAREIQDQCFFPDGLLCTLRRYQEWGVKYILHQGNALLGDEMGLGKTVQAIATMVSLKNTGATHFLVICPAAVVTNWIREITRHSKLRAIKVHGGTKKSAFSSWLKNGGVCVTNFESTSVFTFPADFKYSLLIVDEAHYIKNPNSNRTKNTLYISEHAERRLFMTGTPIENNVDEMIGLIDNLNQSVANKVRNYAYMVQAKSFREKIAPVYYRRKREDVLTELPDKIEIKEWCTLNDGERLQYEDAVLSKRYNDSRRVSWNIDDLNKSSKALRLKQIVEEAEADGRKILVFSFFLDTIRKLYSFLEPRCLEPINGSVNINRRQEIIDKFDKSEPGTVLLAQINSGGTGLNIQSASVVIICEPQFKPSIENQAISRAYRMGQTRKVLVYRLLCEESIDERITNILETKQKIFDAFADKSVAAQQQFEIDDSTMKNIIDEEIERINKKRGIAETSNREIVNVEEKPIVQIEDINYYNEIMKMSYKELVEKLLKKYGKAKYNYFTDETCERANKNISRTKEGLVCHHINEYKYQNLSNSSYAKSQSFENQLSKNLVYCNMLEHLLLHILIYEETKNSQSGNGITGAEYISRSLNDMYSGYEFKKTYNYDLKAKIIDFYDVYVTLIKRLLKTVENDKFARRFYSKANFARATNGIYTKFLQDISSK